MKNISENRAWLLVMAMVCAVIVMPRASAEDTVWRTSFESSNEDPAVWANLFEGTHVVHEYDKANSGEEFLVVDGLNDYHQYSFESDTIPVEPGGNYALSFAYWFSPKVTRYGINVYAFGFDEAKNPVAIPLEGWAEDEVGTFYPVHGPGSGGWQESYKRLVLPENVHWVVFRLRHGSLPSGEWVYLDNFSLAKDRQRVKASYEIDSARSLLSGRVTMVPASLASQVKRYRVLLYAYDPEADSRPIYASQPPEGGTNHEPYYNTDFSVHVVGQVRQELTLDPSDPIFSLDLTDEPDRAYCLSIVAELADGSQLKSEDTLEDSVFYVMHQPSWLGNQLGVLGEDDAPPPPWSPIAYDAEALRVVTWNNRLSFNPDLSLKRIRYQDNRSDALARQGAQLIVNDEAIDQQVVFSAPQVTRQTPHTIELVVEGKGDRFDVVVKATVEFDGFVRYDLRFDAREPMAIESVEAMLSLNKNFARFVHPTDFREITVLDEASPVWETDGFEPSMWIGNEETGLVCCTYAQTEQKAAALSASLRDGQWRLALLPEPVRLETGQSLSVTYALQPTPTRPRLAEFRDLDMRDPTETDLELLWSNPPYFVYPGVPIGRDAAIAWAETVKAKPGVPWAMFYQTTAYYMTTIPEATWFADRWRAESGSNAYINEMPGWTHWSGDLVPVNFNDPLWQDYYCSALDLFLENSAFDGLYFDVSGGGLDAEGDIFNRRDFNKRIYVILKRHRSNGIELFHTINHRSTPYVSFADLFCRGEAYRVDLASHDYYLEFMTLDQFRAATAASTGQGVMFLPQYRQIDKRNNPTLAAHAIGLVLLHDMNIWPSWMNGEVIERTREFRRSFGTLAEAQFFGYWDKRSEAFFTVDAPQIVSSVFEADGNLFAIFLNQSNESVVAQVRFHSTTLDSHVAMRNERHAVFFDPADGATTSYNVNDLWNTPVELEFAPYQCRLMKLK